MGTEKKENLEEMFDRLDQVIGTLEGEDVSLEEAFGLYDQGMKLIRRCNQTINEVEKKILVLDENGDKIADVTYVNGRPVEPMTTGQVDEVRTAIKNAVFYNDLERDCIAIVCEEAGQFMENSKTIDETIEIIQNRVQLMLDERK